MASETNQHSSDSTSQVSSTVQDLRALAQSHLTTIEAEDAENETREAAAARDLQKYAKVRRKHRPKESPTTAAAATPTPPPDTKGERLRSAQDVLGRLRHDPGLRLSEYRVGYLERFEGIKEMQASSWISESTDEEWIPQHRIKYVKRIYEDGNEEVVWDREARVDKVFGSGSDPSSSSSN